MNRGLELMPQIRLGEHVGSRPDNVQLHEFLRSPAHALTPVPNLLVGFSSGDFIGFLDLAD